MVPKEKEAMRRKDVSKERNQMYKLQGGRWEAGRGREQAGSEVQFLFPLLRETWPCGTWCSGNIKAVFPAPDMRYYKEFRDVVLQKEMVTVVVVWTGIPT